MPTDVSSVTKHFPSAENGFTTTLSGTISSGATTVGLNSVAGYSNGEVAVFVVDPSDAAKKQTFTGTIDTSGVQVTNVVWTSGTNQTHTAGSTVVDYATATHISMMTKGLLVAHDQTGVHKSGATYASPVFSGTATGTYEMAGTGTYTAPTLVTPVIKTFDGWQTGSGTWTYASATTFTVPTADAAVMSVGTKIKLTQTTTKYFYVTGVSGTTITVTGGSDYTVANAAITAPYFSNAATPQGFPGGLNYTPSNTNITVGTGGSAENAGRFYMVGSKTFFAIKIKLGTSGASIGSNPYIGLPVAASSFYSASSPRQIIMGQAWYNDVTGANNGGVLSMNSGGTTSNAQLIVANVAGTFPVMGGLNSTAPFTWAASDEIIVEGSYEAA